MPGIHPFRLLVAYDGSSFGGDMIEDLRYAGVPSGSQVLVVSVAERWLPPPSVYEAVTTPGVARNEKQAERMAMRGACQIAAKHPEWTIEHEGHSGSPARVIVQRAREWGADLVVAGSLGHGAIEGVLLGSVSRKIANEAPCSVRISRGWRLPDRLRLVLAYDANPGAGKAADALAARVWPGGTSVQVVAATGFGGSPLGECRLPVDQRRVEALLAPAVESLVAAGLTVRTTIEAADPRELLVQEAARLDAHCIFAGCNDHTIIDRLLLGTVSNALISRAPCAMEVVR